MQFSSQLHKADAAPEILIKTGFDYFCFHDYDLIAEGPTFAGSERRLLLQ